MGEEKWIEYGRLAEYECSNNCCKEIINEEVKKQKGGGPAKNGAEKAYIIVLYAENGQQSL